jgi:hypothetical protein
MVRTKVGAGEWYDIDMEKETFTLRSPDRTYPGKRMGQQLYADMRAVQEFDFIAMCVEDRWPMLFYNIDKISFDKACELFKEFVKEYNEP